ncbi:PREDICTED: 3-ketoacyl-CoA synthase 12-like [Tarenaya hassleriana]|uniref:3-ketoacyl-CoA synthase 12-like n=1 Tax=Tarenaya hassleriana TaxID=28532 RepID=UPI00053C9990|nr:PREDICTED: 3-ketoacyl-CoA synthase 12-like [Tarenaya hassleriana]
MHIDLIPFPFLITPPPHTHTRKERQKEKLIMDLLFLCMYSLLVSYLFFMIWKLIDSKRDQECYILDYQCYKPSDDRMVSTHFSGEIIRRNQNLRLNEYKFLLKAIVSSGIGEQTYAPRLVFEGREENPTIRDGILEMEEFYADCVGKLLERNTVSPQEIDVLVVNVSMLSSVPSLSSRIINHYKMREDVKVFNLTGMGCSASLISIDIVKNIFKNYKNMYGLVVTSESLSPNWYSGNNRSMILANCLFRSGGCAMLMTNKRSLSRGAMFKLKCMVRTHHGSRDDSYNCCIQTEDEEGRMGFHLGKNLPKAATRAFVDNLKVITPKILPVTELLRFMLSLMAKRLRRNSSKGSNASNLAPAAPKAGINFKTGIEHFCIHTGGKAVIDGIGYSLDLSEYDLEPARMTLHRFGNTSASSLWYVLAYMEAKKRLKRGDRVFMISFGAGFKCNSCVWEVVRDLGHDDGDGDDDDGNVWKHCIDNYPPKSILNPYLEKYGWIQNEDDPDTFKFPDDQPRD